ncbi:hypothetical protein M8J75_013596 [Diaphorina citri]|nr:hypothetical protein M8J75_013596 [Diaphorina citri]
MEHHILQLPDESEEEHKDCFTRKHRRVFEIPSNMSRYSLWEVTSLLCISLVMLLSLFTVASGLPYHIEGSKRGLDLGLSRGFSGSQAAKHLMGLAAANYAGGPGRRRRSDSDQYLSS